MKNRVKGLVMVATVVVAYFIGAMSEPTNVVGTEIFSDGTEIFSDHAVATTNEMVMEINGKEYIDINHCIPLTDIDCAWVGEDDYVHFSLGDVGNIADDPYNRSYESVVGEINARYSVEYSGDYVTFSTDEYSFDIHR